MVHERTGVTPPPETIGQHIGRHTVRGDEPGCHETAQVGTGHMPIGEQVVLTASTTGGCEHFRPTPGDRSSIRSSG